MQTRSSITLVTLLITAATLGAQDTEFIRALDRAQQSRPATLTSTSRIADPAEPGTPLVLRGRALDADGRTALSRAVVFAYHTDRGGLYDVQGSPAHSWRLRGWARTGDDGRFEFQTIRPGAYPGGRIPAHVHFTIFTSSGQRYHAGEIQFDDDPIVPARARAAWKSAGAIGIVRPVRTENGVQIVDVNLRVDAREKF